MSADFGNASEELGLPDSMKYIVNSKLMVVVRNSKRSAERLKTKPGGPGVFSHAKSIKHYFSAYIHQQY